MDSCSFSSIEAAFDSLVAEVAEPQGVDPVCSTSDWIVPLADAFSSRARSRVFRSESGFLALLEHPTANGPVVTGFDSVWGFATPLIGRDPERLVADVAVVIDSLDFHVLTISGLDPAGPLFDEVQRLGPAGYTDTADRCVADLSGGFDEWLGRRSKRFRRSLRAAANRAEAGGVTLERLAPTDDDAVAVAFRRILAVEAKSWKTDAHSGLVGTKLGVFTRAMAQRFAATGGLRVEFARFEDRDIGYVIGARVGHRYRGFQHSFDKDLPDLSIGKLLQFHTIGAMAAEGVTTYDMGMHMSYKESYADRIESTVTAVIPGRH